MRAIILALAVLITTAAPSFAQAAAPQAPATPAPQAPATPGAAPAAAVPNARVFNGGAGLILYTIKPGSAADFDMVLNKTKESLTKSEKPERKQQAETWRVYTSDAPGAGCIFTYVMIIDPSIK